MNNPFARPRVKPKRTEPRRTGDRVRLRGEKMTELRRQAFERSGGRCEAEVLTPLGEKNLRNLLVPWRCPNRITWESMELMHKQHGPRKSDTLDTVLAGCKECHRNEHNAGGKPVARKPGRVMNHKEAIAYWRGTECFCGGEKASEISFCADCLRKLPRQIAYDVHNSIGDYYLKALALAEQVLLKDKV